MPVDRLWSLDLPNDLSQGRDEVRHNDRQVGHRLHVQSLPVDVAHASAPTATDSPFGSRTKLSR